ncbi:tRNA (N6-isopentenyl adenosine(37)-C2)-methylthiotransferase MiaB [Buchnera aphidicola]|uniref:tRNA-2-methylthio-N(6)-dimethylallyladenosine synthase n=1 Tax=Buchnera aphidicola (Anoecia oenotherae) TaxID=1241833 RepID=A0A4D6XRJ6_9GAMM|nr:tRNA (N6-isopentenyl adenosine(37)-C2)-methylthiotransferase MiaB [Buchnera aphidicola]QCI19456.1 tRNA (N6-isopentenyl adenosine(37)-C2)-methylthiotransferase MiaB [Buchnera aphidicola (Anoecia oenotherae)]
MKKVYIKTWGCQMNEYDSTLIKSFLEKKESYLLIDNAKKADILILNTCSIREKAQEKLFHQLGRWRKLKKDNPNIIIAVGGCVATQEGIKIFNRANYINIIFGTQTLHRLPNMIKSAIVSKKLIVDVINYKSIEKFDNIQYTVTSISRISSLVAIMEGCNKYCSFCIVPYTRGREVSRPVIDIINEIKQLTKLGTREVILLGQNVNSYFGEYINGKKCDFSKLLYYISEINEIYRIRFITSHPLHFTNNLIHAYSKIPQLIDSLHLPVQSGSDRILKLMRRRYSTVQYKIIIEKLKSIRPKMHISSDFIIGFPGETEIDFKKTMALVKDVYFDMSFSFLYSPRPGTPASILKQNTSIEERKKRLFMLQNKIIIQSKKLSLNMLNTTQSVLVDGIAKNDIMKLSGKTMNNRTVYFEGRHSCIGKIVKINITNVSRHTLIGRVI